jgi:ribosomal protein S18 acetylase RimI-like enzyme
MLGDGRMLTDADLYVRGGDTLVASWEEYAAMASGAVVHRLPGVAAAVFPRGPEREVYNNALLARDLVAVERAGALDAMERTYSAAGVTRFAAWVHESDEAMRSDIERHGYALDTSTRAMGMALADARRTAPEIELGSPDWAEHLRIVGVPAGFLSSARRLAFHVLVARFGGANVATAIAFDFQGDCGIYNLGTLEAARRRGLGTGLTSLHLQHALERGCETASVQSTEMAEGVYGSVGFRDLGLVLEYVPRG